MQYFSYRTKKPVTIPKNHIKSGGDGDVYLMDSTTAAKIYRTTDSYKTDKLKAMLANPPKELIHIYNNKAYHRFAWPTDILLNNRGLAAGFLMPYIDVKTTIDIDNYYDGVKQKINHITPQETALSHRVDMARNFSLAIAELHALGHHFVDLKPANVKVYRNIYFICLLDCDGFSIQGSGRRFPATLYTSEYISPEALKSNADPKTLNESQDRFALAVILFQLMNYGIHPYQGIVQGNINVQATDDFVKQDLYPHGLSRNPKIKPKPLSVHEFFDRNTRMLFDRAFMENPQSRPTAREWQLHWDRHNKPLLQQCGKIKNDYLHIRFTGMGCPTCHRENFAGKPIRCQVNQTTSGMTLVQQPVTATMPLSNTNTVATPTWIRWLTLIGIVVLSIFIILLLTI